VQEALDFPFDGYELVLDEVARLAAVQPGMRILELGIGTGTLTKRLVNSGCAIWGVDFSTEMLALAQVNLPQIVLVQADILGDWPVELNRRYDRIVSAYVFHEFDMSAKMALLERLREQYLTPDGYIVIGDISFPTAEDHSLAHRLCEDEWDEDEYYWVAEEATEACRQAGLAVEYRQVSQFGGVFVIGALNSEMPRKPIRAVVETGPNYIFHLLAVAKIGFNSEYSSQYLRTVKQADIKYLRAHHPLLAFADGHLGGLAGLMIFLPCYLNLDTRAKLQEFFDLLLVGLRDRRYESFLDRYREAITRLNLWIQCVDSQWLDSHVPYCEIISGLAEVYTDNFDAYVTDVWPHEKQAIESVAALINVHFLQTEIIFRWETLAGRPFQFDYYEIVLCSATKNGPNVNSLGYERNVFYSGLDFALLTQFISHEVGTHILIDIIKQVFSQGSKCKYPFDLVYRTYENLAKFYNSRILGDTNTYDGMYGALGNRVQCVLGELYAANPRLSPEELFWQAVERLG